MVKTPGLMEVEGVTMVYIVSRTTFLSMVEPNHSSNPLLYDSSDMLRLSGTYENRFTIVNNRIGRFKDKNVHFEFLIFS